MGKLAHYDRHLSGVDQRVCFLFCCFVDIVYIPFDRLSTNKTHFSDILE